MSTIALEPRFDLDAEEAARGDFYAVLSRLFAAPPDVQFLQALAQAVRLEEAARSDFAAAWDALCHAAAGDAAAIADEYARLFSGVSRPDVMLYGSWYLAGFMMEKPLAQLRDDLAELGLARAAGISEPEDHISALADVLRHLATDTRRPPAERAALTQRFFGRHLAPWYARLAEALELAPAADFYRSAGRFARAFLDLEKASFLIEV